ncbi:hypothetical protein [Paeniglutamicibacter cryotolerans]|uniref:Uncharacterized protein n=1 Tax=Paeniglutamicibacter cryotolerans TaxID=670079 RepID=A0A839QYE0_9MICC|nr:hypothetical protein [Paeniglutamicibacter cryotolerans]MBB2996971.1 hypothetical protein [Paeniglutamicibacter cryotolerans]
MIRSLVHEAVLRFMAGVTGIMATMLLVSTGGPAVASSLPPAPSPHEAPAHRPRRWQFRERQCAHPRRNRVQ